MEMKEEPEMTVQAGLSSVLLALKREQWGHESRNVGSL